MDVETSTSGHEQITDKVCVRAMKGYFVYITAKIHKRYDAWMSEMEVGQGIPLDDHSCLGDAERIVANVNTLYRAFVGDDSGRCRQSFW